MRSTFAALVALVAVPAAAFSLATAPSANADSIGVKDPRDINHGVDLRSVEVDHGTDDIRIVTTHTNLRRSFRSGSSGAVYLDTDPARRGPEYVFVGGYFVGTDYTLLKTDGFGSHNWGRRVKGSYDLSLDFADEQVRMRVATTTLGSPERVRVAVRVAGTRSDGTSKGLVDWLRAPRSFTDWVAQ
ncbi:hypothetical protein [Nocardioides piscis]|uniref:Uncharacterized protein n=1 Tax=Nocardioides piscis TaxID=2714938 RepID=A0A6G7YBT9_9ACTN|nr:hypothetical protein [Nocardioides piscis]QIK74230.1 hypothetical protein G7071_01030 [Nocardioides piscis]